MTGVEGKKTSQLAMIFRKTSCLDYVGISQTYLPHPIMGIGKIYLRGCQSSAATYYHRPLVVALALEKLFHHH